MKKCNCGSLLSYHARTCPRYKPEQSVPACSARLLAAAKDADWQQVVGNGGPPCFHIEDSRFCLRAKRWDGHKTIGGSGPIHNFVSLESLLRSISPKRNKLRRSGEQPKNMKAENDGPILNALPESSCSALLAALEEYNKKHTNHRGYNKLQLYSDGSGYIVDEYDERLLDKQFDSIEAAIKMLRS